MAERNWKEIQVDTNGDVWDREEPLEGKFVKVEHDVGPKKSNMYTVETDDGEVKAWGSKVLDDKLLSVPAGTYVKLEYTGKAKGQSGNEYHTFKVFIDEDSVPAETDKPAAKKEAKPDTIVEVGDEPVSLDDIPF